MKIATASEGVQKVVSGEFGFNVKSIFECRQIQFVTLVETEKSIAEMIGMLDSNK